MPRPSTLKESPALRKDPFFTIGIKHLPSGKVVSFQGWVTEFSDQYSSNWSEQSVYGRMDPLATFENTKRTISLGFDIVSDNAAMAAQNLANINYLIEFLYPMYENNGPDSTTGQRGLQTTIKAAPLLGLRWTNLISNSSSPGYLYGYINGGLSYAPEIGEGGFISKDQGGGTQDLNLEHPLSRGDLPEIHVTKLGATSFIPKKVSLSFSFSVLHTHLTGWKEGSGFSSGLNGQFPNAVFVGKDNISVVDGEEVTETLIEVNRALVLEDNS